MCRKETGHNGCGSFNFIHSLHFLQRDAPLAITIAPIEKGLLLSDDDHVNIALITETDIFGTEAVAQRRRRRAKHKDFGEAIKNLVELRKQEPVVHEQYGVGRYLGLERIEHDGKAQDFIRIKRTELIY